VLGKNQIIYMQAGRLLWSHICVIQAAIEGDQAAADGMVADSREKRAHLRRIGHHPAIKDVAGLRRLPLERRERVRVEQTTLNRVLQSSGEHLPAAVDNARSRRLAVKPDRERFHCRAKNRR
jgi:hypothetical protein